jgi:hypothetical protein
MAKRILEDQTKLESTSNKITKKHKVQVTESNPKPSLELYASQQSLYEYIENKEKVDERISSLK